MTTQTVEKWKISELKPHPLQKRFFTNTSAVELKQLADDMKKNGQREAISILPDGTIICGHRRVDAAKRLRWQEIDAVVRHELVGNDRAVEELLIMDNLNRRQLSPLSRARCAKRLSELAQGGKLTSWQESRERGKTRGYVGAAMDMSGRHADRLIQVLETPPSVQYAYDKKKLSITMACQVASLPRDTRQLIHEEIKERGIGHAKEIVKAYLPQKGSTVTGAAKAFGDLVRELDKAVEALGGEVNNLPGCRPKEKQVLERGETLIRTILDRDRERKEHFQSHLAYLCGGTGPGNGEAEDRNDMVLENSSGPAGADEELPESEVAKVDTMSKVAEDTMSIEEREKVDTMSTTEHVADSAAA